MPDNIIAQAADGTQHVFPAGTDISVIDAAMKRYVSSGQPGAMQSFKGGQVINSRNFAPPPTDTGITPGAAAREATLGGFSGMGIPETQTPVTDLGKNLLEQIGTMFGAKAWQGKDPYGKEALKANPIVSVPTAVASGFGNAVDAVNPVIDNLFRAITGNKPRQFDAGKSIHDIASFGSTLGTLKTAKEAPEALTDPLAKGSLRTIGQEVMGQGPSKVNVLSDQHAHAIATQQHIATVADAVHQDAQNAMSRVSQAVDAAKPEGFDKGEIGARLKTAIGDTLSDTSQLPKSVQKLMPTEAVGKQAGPNIGGKVLDLAKPEDMAAYQKYKDSGAFTPEEIARYEGKATGSMTFEDVKQARSDLGKQMQNLQGAPKAAASAAYGELSKVLREGARDAGQEPDWIDANARWKNYLDDFHRSPLAKVLDSENAHDIMDPLSGKSRIQVNGILQKYTPFGLDMDRINQEIAGFGTGETVLKMSNPTKMDLLLARLSPSAVILRQAGPRLFRNPSVIRAIGGEGFEPANIKPNKIFPSKEAAAAALKGKGLPQGKPSLFSGEGETPIEQERRAPARAKSMDESIAEKKAADEADAEAKRQAWEKEQRKGKE